MCEEVREVRNGKLVAAFALLLVVSFAAMNAMPSDTLLAVLLQEAVLARVALAAVRLVVPDALKRCTESVQQQGTVRFSAIALLLTGFIGGTIVLLTWYFGDCGNGAGLVSAASPSAAGPMENLLFLLDICLITGLDEEAFMRVLGIEAFERALDTKRAVLASAALFALLHVVVPDISAGQPVLFQTALKFVQALLFGVILGMLYAQTRRLWPCALVHAGFDVLYLGPNVLLTGEMPVTYASGMVGDTVLLVVTVLMLAGVALKMCKEIAR